MVPTLLLDAASSAVPSAEQEPWAGLSGTATCAAASMLGATPKSVTPEDEAGTPIGLDGAIDGRDTIAVELGAADGLDGAAAGVTSYVPCQLGA